MANITNITPPRVPLLDPRNGLITREWYLFFLNLFNQTGQSTASLEDLQKGPPIEAVDTAAIVSEAQLSSGILPSDLAPVETSLQALASAPQPDLGTMATVQQDNVRFVRFSPVPSPPVVPQLGSLAWNPVEQTAEMGMDYGVVQQIGLEYYARVENATSVTIPNGTVVGFAGVGPNNTLSVAPYLADGATPSLYILGVMTHALPNSGEIGYCTVWGHVQGVDTSAFNVGDILYASPTVAGAFTNVKPTAPNNVIPVAAVLAVDAINGEIFVRPTIEQEQYYGEFFNTTGVTPAAPNTAYAMAWGGTAIANGVTVAGTPVTQITVSESGLYQFNARIQFTSTNSSIKSAWVWWRLNGTTDYANSAVIGTLSDNGGYLVVRNSGFFSLAANDYVELMWAVNDVVLAPTNVAATAFAPAAPCALVEVTQIQQ
jgi:hypothetical protein